MNNTGCLEPSSPGARSRSSSTSGGRWSGGTRRRGTDKSRSSTDSGRRRLAERVARPHKARERTVGASRPTDEKSDSTTSHAAPAGAPRECAGWCACVACGVGTRGVGVGVPAKREALASRGHDDSARRPAAESAPCVGALAKTPAYTTRRATRLGHRAPRPLCPRTVQGR
ncbi:hypothetical protein FB451DRAFT_1175265 [Mycena latifolia]|nr:hypothetical protein FB451DRAFT_1175265 [Mycena latifolia]